MANGHLERYQNQQPSGNGRAIHGGPNTIRVRGMSETGSSVETDRAPWVPARGRGGCPSGTEFLPGKKMF